MNWNDLKFFLAVAREGQMLGAAKRMGVSQARLSRHIAALEEAVGARLFDRTTKGSVLTPDGSKLRSSAEKIEQEVIAGLSNLVGSDQVEGTVRIGTPDGFGSAYLAPRLSRFRQTFPKLKVQLVPVSSNFSLSEREADIAVMVGRPDRGRLQVSKLVDYTLGVYAAKSYLDRNPRPETPKDLAGHTLIGYVDDLVSNPALHYAQEMYKGWSSDIEVSTTIGQFEALCAGAGICTCHDYMAAHRDDLVRLFDGLSVQRSYWTVWHDNLRVAPHVRSVGELLKTLIREDRAIFAPDLSRTRALE